MKFYICKHCGNIIAFAEDKGVPVVCCGEKMSELVPGTTDKVGEVEHPMLEEHHIAWIALETKEGNQRKPLPVDGKPQATFALTDGDEVIAAYEYCNLHGLWKAEA